MVLRIRREDLLHERFLLQHNGLAIHIFLAIRRRRALIPTCVALRMVSDHHDRHIRLLRKRAASSASDPSANSTFTSLPLPLECHRESSPNTASVPLYQSCRTWSIHGPITAIGLQFCVRSRGSVLLSFFSSTIDSSVACRASALLESRSHGGSSPSVSTRQSSRKDRRPADPSRPASNTTAEDSSARHQCPLR